MALLPPEPAILRGRLDFTTSSSGEREADHRPMEVITDLGILERDPDDGELVLTALHGETTLEQAREATGWELRAVDEPRRTPPPSAEELRALRELRKR